MAASKQQLSVVEASNVGLGQNGSGVLAAGESAASLGSKVIVAITMLDDCGFTTLTAESADHVGTGTSTHANSIDSNDTFPVGVTIFGRWSACTLSSGLCIFYFG